jgi:hypothetical protein
MSVACGPVPLTAPLRCAAAEFVKGAGDEADVLLQAVRIAGREKSIEQQEN